MREYDGYDEHVHRPNGHYPNGTSAKPNGQAPEPRLKLVPFSALQLSTARSYLIKDLVPRHGISLVWGPPKCCKSFWAFDLGMHVALGREYYGRKIVAGPVVYCAFEGADGYKKRAEAFRQSRLAKFEGEVQFFLLGVRLDLVAEHRDLIASIREQLGSTTVPALIVLDTLNRSMTGSESVDEDMGNYIKAADAIRAAFDCAVLIVHHCGTDERRPRGHTSLTGAVEAQLAVKKEANGLFHVTVEYMKDGPEGGTMSFRLQRVVLGFDEDGDEIDSCVVESTDQSREKPAAKQRKLNDRQKNALKALTAVCATKGMAPLPALGLPASISCVRLEDWHQELFARDVLSRDAANPREDFKRVKAALQARELISVRDGLVWAL